MDTPARPANERRSSAAAFIGMPAAVAVIMLLPLVLPPMTDVVRLAVYLASLAVVAAALMLTHRLPIRSLPAELGMDRPAAAGIGWALLLTLPMLAGFLLLQRGALFEPDTLDGVARRPWAVVRGTLAAGLVEETIFRGYFFRQLVRRGRWNIGWAMLVCGVVFGLLHIPGVRHQPIAEILGVAALTGVGGVFFCWLLLKWDWNLWFVIGWHAFVNLWWLVGQAGETAVGGLWGNILRAAVIALTVWVTLRRAKSANTA